MKFKANVYLGSLYQLIIVFLFFWLSRLIFIFHNSTFLDINGFNDILKICVGGTRIDASIFAYLNSLFILMRFAPLPWVYNHVWIKISNWILIIINSFCLILNIVDTVYFPFTGYRMSWLSFMNVVSDPESLGLFFSFFTRFWWAYILGAAILALMIWLITRVRLVASSRYTGPKSVLWITKSFIFLLVGGFTFMCMRGWTNFKDRPLERATGVNLVDNIRHFSAVLNTPFSIFFSIKSDVTIERKVFMTETELTKVRPGIISHPEMTMNRKNIFLIIIESGGSIHSKIFNPVASDSAYNKSLAFVDSLAAHSVINRNLYASGRTSTQGITQIFTSMPYFGSSYLVESPYAENTFDSPARLLAREGYDTRFYYGCTKGNYHIDETAQLAGFETIRTRESFDNDKEFDGKWGIWDKPMAEYVVKDITENYNKNTPFFASWFTITAHEPNSFPQNENVADYTYPQASPERAMEYTDRALRLFFDLAKKQPWFDNTIFIITSDHGQRNYNSFHTENMYVYSHLPFIIYAPDGTISPEIIDDLPMSQIDIAPTLLDLAGYNKPYVTFGTSVLDSSHPHFGLAESFGRYYIFGKNYIVSLSAPGQPAEEVLDINEKPFPITPLENYNVAETDSMVYWFNALMQDFSTRINDNRLSATLPSK